MRKNLLVFDYMIIKGEIFTITVSYSTELRGFVFTVQKLLGLGAGGHKGHPNIFGGKKITKI